MSAQELKRLLDDDEDMNDMFLQRAQHLPKSPLNSHTSKTLIPPPGDSRLLCRRQPHCLDQEFSAEPVVKLARPAVRSDGAWHLAGVSLDCLTCCAILLL